MAGCETMWDSLQFVSIIFPFLFHSVTANIGPRHPRGTFGNELYVTWFWRIDGRCLIAEATWLISRWQCRSFAFSLANYLMLPHITRNNRHQHSASPLVAYACCLIAESPAVPIVWRRGYGNFSAPSGGSTLSVRRQTSKTQRAGFVSKFAVLIN